jgi:hypothetical protein
VRCAERSRTRTHGTYVENYTNQIALSGGNLSIKGGKCWNRSNEYENCNNRTSKKRIKTSLFKIKFYNFFSLKWYFYKSFRLWWKIYIFSVFIKETVLLTTNVVFIIYKSLYLHNSINIMFFQTCFIIISKWYTCISIVFINLMKKYGQYRHTRSNRSKLKPYFNLLLS